MKRNVKTAKAEMPDLDFESDMNKSRVIQILASLETAYEALNNAQRELMSLKGYDHSEDFMDICNAKKLIRQVQGEGPVMLLGLFKGWSKEGGK